VWQHCTARFCNVAAILADSILARLGRAVPLIAGTSEGTDAELSWRLVIPPVKPARGAVALDQIDLAIATLTAPSSHIFGIPKTG